jgi:hypothetical protein
MATLTMILKHTGDKPIHGKVVLQAAVNFMKLLGEIEKQVSKKRPVVCWQVAIIQARGESIINLSSDEPLAVSIIEKAQEARGMETL